MKMNIRKKMVEMHEGGYLYFKLQAPNLFTGLTLQNLQFQQEARAMVRHANIRPPPG
jgi:hypothetical protein